MEHFLHLLVYGITIILFVLAATGPIVDHDNDNKGVRAALIIAGIMVLCFATMIVDLCHSLCTRLLCCCHRRMFYLTSSLFTLPHFSHPRQTRCCQMVIGGNEPLNQSDQVRSYDTKLPIIYSPKYNITACGIENAHPFDSKKYGRVMKGLLDDAIITSIQQVIEPRKPTRDELLLVHSPAYLAKLHSSTYLTTILEVPVCCLPSWFIRWRVLEPMLYGVGGSILGARIAYHRGWCINLSGGYHHASSDRGSGFCVYADITLAIQHLRKNVAEIQKVIIVDLDAHQGNGHERDFLHDTNTFIMDMYNSSIYPVCAPCSHPVIDHRSYVCVVIIG
jgi:hypothetical protein